MSDGPSELDRRRAELAATKAELVRVRAVGSNSEALILALKLEIAKLKREQYGTRSVSVRPDCPAALIEGEIVSASDSGHYGVLCGSADEAALD